MRSYNHDLMIELCGPQQIPQLYISRAHWEEQFRRLNLWPAMLSHDGMYQSYSDHIDRVFPEFQLAAVLKSEPPAVVGIAHSVPLQITEDQRLPETGWDFAMETAFDQHRSSLFPNSLCGISITVLEKFQRRELGAD